MNGDEQLFEWANSADDPELSLVIAELQRLDPTGEQVATVLRDTLDQLLDGRRRGRWSYSELLKTEKTHMGTLVEINLGRHFLWDAEDDDPTDYRIAGVPVDCKFSGTGGWMIGPELIGHLCLVVQADDLTSSWRMGLVRAHEANLNLGKNRDAKVSLNAAGRAHIHWMYPQHGRLEQNLLLHLDPARRERIMTALSSRGRPAGLARLMQLCREVQGRTLRRAVIETVGYGLDDPLKRMRDNGGAREKLRPEGYLILGHQDNDPLVATALALPPPHKGEFLSVRVVPDQQDGRPAAEIEGSHWVVAKLDEEIVVPAPVPKR